MTRTEKIEQRKAIMAEIAEKKQEIENIENEDEYIFVNILLNIWTEDKLKAEIDNFLKSYTPTRAVTMIRHVIELDNMYSSLYKNISGRKKDPLITGRINMLEKYIRIINE